LGRIKYFNNISICETFPTTSVSYRSNDYGANHRRQDFANFVFVNKPFNEYKYLCRQMLEFMQIMVHEEVRVSGCRLANSISAIYISRVWLQAIHIVGNKVALLWAQI
jgi:hypothetical protein